MNDTLLFLILLLTRWLFLREDRRVTLAGILPKTLLEIAAIGLLAATPAPVAPLLVVVVLTNLVLWLHEKFIHGEAPGLRALTLLALALTFWLSDPIPLQDWTGRLASSGLPIAIGALLGLKESNYVIRWFFRHHRLADKIREMPHTENGRLIGNLERLLLLVFLWQDVPVAAPIIVAVKGLARFKQMDDTPFAEYVIIGTFLSVLCAFAAYHIGYLL